MIQKITLIDIETPNGHNDSICQFGIKVISDKTEIFNDCTLINPEAEFSSINSGIHGIKMEMVQDAPTIAEYWSKISDFFNDAVIVGHNIKYDLCVLTKALYKYNVSLPELPIICTKKLAEKYLSLDKYSLSNVCEYFDIPTRKAHDAGEDVEMCFSVYAKFAEKLPLLSSDITYYQFCCGQEKKQTRQPSYSQSTKSTIELKQIVDSIMKDGVIEKQEVLALEWWISQHEELLGYYPYDRLSLTLNNILADGVITSSEYEELAQVFNEILDPIQNNNETASAIDIREKTFCLTGDFNHGDRKDVEQLLISKGGIRKTGVSSKLDYLIVGDKGSQAWKFGNYGGKVQKAMELKEKGAAIQIIGEIDFFSALL